jgi:hypothetical protein
LKFEGENIRFQTPKIDYVMYDLPATTTEESGFELAIVLNEKPASNVFTQDIETTGLEFYPQLPLNEEQHEAGLVCTATECKDAQGRVMASRPEDIVDSIAVYASGKSGDYSAMGGMNYMAGKVVHIKRIKMIDSAGDTAYCKQNIANNLWTITCPQEWLDRAVYPVVIDPTFGNTTAGGSNKWITPTYYFGIPVTATGSGDVDKFTAYGYEDKSGDLYARGVLQNSTNRSSVFREGFSDSVLVPAGSGNVAWFDMPYTTKPSITNGNEYVLCILCNSGSANLAIKYDTGVFAYGIQSDYATAYENPNDWGSTGTFYSSGQSYLSIYATYTSGGASEETQGVLIE